MGATDSQTLGQNNSVDKENKRLTFNVFKFSMGPFQCPVGHRHRIMLQVTKHETITNFSFDENLLWYLEKHNNNNIEEIAYLSLRPTIRI